MAQEEKMIDYLSKEIETQSKNLMTFRERINFALFVGPFLLLGAALYGGKDLPRINWGTLPLTVWIILVLCSLGVILSYLTMGIACSLVEVHMWKQCNVWRGLISQISRGNKNGFTLGELGFEERVRRGYHWVYGAMITAFVSAITLILTLQAHVP